MVVTVIWVALLALAVAWEARCRQPGSPWTSLSGLGARIARRLPGRVALLVVWAFVGWHVFARYTIPG